MVRFVSTFYLKLKYPKICKEFLRVGSVFENHIQNMNSSRRIEEGFKNSE